MSGFQLTADISMNSFITTASCPALLSILSWVWPVNLYRLMSKKLLFCSSWYFYSQSKITLVYLSSERKRACFPITFLSLLLEITGASHMHYISYNLSLWEIASLFLLPSCFQSLIQIQVCLIRNLPCLTVQNLWSPLISHFHN